MQENYKILGISENATVEEIEKAYKVLKEKYSKERFYEGEVGNEAAKMLTKVETAYYEIMSSKKTTDEKKNVYVDFTGVEKAIKDGNLTLAQQLLDDISERNAEWHYLQSVIFYKKNWTNESKKQLEIALSMDPRNPKYATAYEKLKQKMEHAQKQFHSGNAQYTSSNATDDRQMGGNACGSIAECCCINCAINALCNSCCR